MQSPAIPIDEKGARAYAANSVRRTIRTQAREKGYSVDRVECYEQDGGLVLFPNKLYKVADAMDGDGVDAERMSIPFLMAIQHEEDETESRLEIYCVEWDLFFVITVENQIWRGKKAAGLLLGMAGTVVAGDRKPTKEMRKLFKDSQQEEPMFGGENSE